MTKIEFLDKLQELIQEYPSEETQQSLDYYSEMIDDRMEDGMTEAEVIASLGPVEKIAEQIKCELPITTLVKHEIKGKRMPVWSIVLLIIGSPLWLSIVVTIAVVVLSLYLTVWLLALAFWICDLSFAVSAVACVFALVVSVARGHILTGVFYLGAGLILAALAIFVHLASFYISKGIVVGTKGIFHQIKKSIVDKKEEAA